MKFFCYGLLLASALVGGVGAQTAEWNAALNRARALEVMGKYTDAASAFRQAAAISDLFGADPRRWMTYNAMAVAYDEAGDSSHAIQTYRHALEMIRAGVGQQNDAYALVLSNLAAAYLGRGEVAPAEKMLREALAIEQQLPQPNRMRLAALRSRLAETLVLRHRTKECEQMLDMAIPLLHDVSETEELSIALNSLALVRRMQHRYSEAADLLLESVTALEKKYGPDHPLLLRSVSNLAVVYSLEGRNEDAKAQFEHASRICEAHVRPGHPTYMAFLENYAEFLRRTGDKKDAKAMQARARAMAQENPRSAEAMTVDVSAFRH